MLVRIVEEISVRKEMLKDFLFMFSLKLFRKDKIGFKLVKCPVCKTLTFDSYWICPRCGFEHDDNCVRFPSMDTSNGKSLNDYKRWWEANK